MSDHARLSPSKFESIMLCPGKLAMEETCPPESGESGFAAEGTAAHALAAKTLETKAPSPHTYLGETMYKTYSATKDMCDFVQIYVDVVRRMTAGMDILVEQKVDVSSVVGVPGQFGTADVIAIGGGALHIHDLKYGMGVAVVAERNVQLMVYALAALREYSTIFGDIQSVVLVIHMPRLDYVSEWTISTADLEAWAATASKAGVDAIKIADAGLGPNKLAEFLTPGEKQCRFCKAKGKCPAYNQYVNDAIGGDFDDISRPKAKRGDPTPDELAQLGEDMLKVDMVEQWCKAKRALTEAYTFGGFKVPGWKLVEGKRGARKFSDPEKAEHLMKVAKLKSDEMYDKSLISVPAAEKLLKKAKPKLWVKLCALVEQADGRPSVAPETDARPAIELKPAADAFEDLTGGDVA